LSCFMPSDQRDQRATGVFSPLWAFRGNDHEADNCHARVAILAPDDRNGRTFYDWISREAFEVDFSPEVDPLIAMIRDAPHRWSTLILDVAHLGAAGDVAAFFWTHRHIFPRLLTILLSKRQEHDEVARLMPDVRYVVLTKPFKRFQLLAALTCREFPRIATMRDIGLGPLD